jgi:diguanylate cyclase (GGDEF)-like protein
MAEQIPDEQVVVELDPYAADVAPRPSADPEPVWEPELVEGIYDLLYRLELGSEDLEHKLDKLRERYGETVYSELIYLLSHLRFESDEALQHWERIQAHRGRMQQALGASVDLRVALVSYFLQVNRKLQNPKIIEMKLFEQTRASAYRDELTGLHNYRLFREYLAQEILRSERHNTPLSLVMVDIDNFKAYNDRNGHEVGNEALAIIAGLLKQSLRQGDVAARYGGEEFVLILPMTSKTNALTVAERARELIEQHGFRKEKSQPGGTLTVSIGIATFPADAREVRELVRQADRAMYVAKANGKNQVQLYGQSRRSFRRISANLAGEYRVLVAESHPLTTVNLSERGVRFQSERPLPVGALIDFRLKVPGAGQPVAACGRVVHVKEMPDGSYQAALRITDMESVDQDALLGYLRRSNEQS